MGELELRRSACQGAIEAQYGSAFASMLHPKVRWYGTDARLRAQAADSVLDSARYRIAAGVLRRAELTAWERAGDRLVVGLRLHAAEGRERTFLCTLAGGQIIEIRDYASLDGAPERLIAE
jgi:hypothetical protein